MKWAKDLGNSLPKMVWMQEVCVVSEQNGLVLGREILGLSVKQTSYISLRSLLNHKYSETGKALEGSIKCFFLVLIFP